VMFKASLPDSEIEDRRELKAKLEGSLK